jgi:hypothetical protein
MAKRTVLLAAVMIVLLALPAAALAQDEPDPRCHPLAGWLASQIGEDWDCEALMALHAEGNGYGNLAKAWYLSHFTTSDHGDWTELIGEPHEENGWGELARAVRLAVELTAQGEEVDPGDLLALRHGQEEDIGWGQLRHAAALAADRGLSFEQALAQLASDEGWSAVYDEQGAPPWAGKFKIKPSKPAKPPKPHQSGDD